MEGGCGVGGGAGGSWFFCVGANFCHRRNISDVVIPFISDRGTPACKRSFHICFLVTCDIPLLVLPAFLDPTPTQMVPKLQPQFHSRYLLGRLHY